VLKVREYGESDGIIILFTPLQGKLPALVKGMRKPQSRLRSGTQQLCCSRFLLYQGRSWPRVIQCELITLYPRLRERAEFLPWALYLAALVEAALPPREPSPSLYFLLKESLRLLPLLDPEMLIRTFEAQTLKILGWEPCLDRCVLCRQPLPEGSRVSFVPSAGGVLCEGCLSTYTFQGAVYQVSPGSLKVWEQLEGSRWWRKLFRLQVGPNFRKELAQIIPAFLEYYLGEKIAARDLIYKIGGLSE